MINKFHKKINWNDQRDLLFYTELYCQKMFREDILLALGVDYCSITNHLQAFLCTKKTLADKLKKNVQVDYPRQAKSVPKAKTTAKANNLAGKEAKRLQWIAENVGFARELLYLNYNQDLLNNFMSKIENILIVELFLNEQNGFFMSESEEAALHNPSKVGESKRKDKQARKSLDRQQLLKYDASNTFKLASIGKFTDYFSRKNRIQIKPLDERHFRYQQNLRDDFKKFNLDFLMICWLALEKKIMKI